GVGVGRVFIESKLGVDLRKLIDSAVQGYGERLSNAKTVEEVQTFMMERLRGYFADKGIATEVYAAVHARHPAQPYDFARRVEAVHAFYQLPDAHGLAAANKRIQNILRQVDGAVSTAVNDELFSENAEWDLAAKLMGLKPRVQKLLSDGQYTEALAALAGLRESVDCFFDEVKVMDDVDAVKNNRLAILASIHELFIETADISRLQA
ncbi:MAG: glycyl-tRNA synthetase beta chain, partial [Gammaproteobacteria bacterium]